MMLPLAIGALLLAFAGSREANGRSIVSWTVGDTVRTTWLLTASKGCDADSFIGGFRVGAESTGATVEIEPSGPRQWSVTITLQAVTDRELKLGTVVREVWNGCKGKSKLTAATVIGQATFE